MNINVSVPLSKIMSTELIFVNQIDTVAAVADAFRKNGIHHLPVVDDSGMLKGIVSKSDFLKISFGWSMFRNAKREDYDNALYQSLLVQDIMTSDLTKLNPEDPISLAIDIFRENLFHCIPIVEHERLVGIVTTYDLLNYAYRQ